VISGDEKSVLEDAFLQLFAPQAMGFRDLLQVLFLMLFFMK